MDALCAAAWDTFREQKERYRAVIAGLPREALNWRPGVDTNSIAVLIAHAWGAGQAWVWRASETEIERDRAAEFHVVLEGPQLNDLLTHAMEQIAAGLEAVDPATYTEIRTSPGGDRYTVARCIVHAVEHNQEHLGHAELTRQMWEQRGT